VEITASDAMSLIELPFYQVKHNNMKNALLQSDETKVFSAI